ncbi:ATP-binding protein [Helicobacter winghamensis]|uniref:ATP-binding protein n=1 Tax=Helicobacter winghamensis TaxID=157268 RepID=UPI0027A64FF6
MDNGWQVRIATNVCEALGVKLYSTLPPVINELVSNSYDADATKIIITIDNSNKTIVCEDDGCGMDSEDITNKFLMISRNRRKSEQTQTTPKFKRRITGRKGLGKLSVFGICKIIEVETIKNNKLNSFRINYDDLISKKENEPYNVEVIQQEQETQENNGTKITLKELIRKTEISLPNLANNCAKRSNFFGDNFTICFRDYNNTQSEITLNSDYRKNIIFKDKQFHWEIPNDIQGKVEQNVLSYLQKNNINGFIITTKKPINETSNEEEQYKGIALYARKKLCQEPSFFGIGTDKSHAFSYMYGEINVDFIDEDTDNIATYRGNVVWNNDEMDLLKINIQKIIRAIGKDWKEKRREEKKEEITAKIGFNIYAWYKEYTTNEQKLAKSITDIIVDNEYLDTASTKTLLEYVQGAFAFKTFRDFADDLGKEYLNNTNILKLLKDWEIIEAKEFYRVSIGRLKIIQKFEQLLNEDTREVVGENDIRDSMHKFLKEFPWLLEPRLSTMNDEISYSRLLLTRFPEQENVLKENRRIDFLCKGFGQELYVIEIKRSQKTITCEDLDQLRDYCEFIEQEFQKETSDRMRYKTVKGYIMGKDLHSKAQIRANAMKNNNMFFLSYKQALEQAKKYHQDFIDTHEQLREKLECSSLQSPCSSEVAQHSQSDEQ